MLEIFCLNLEEKKPACVNCMKKHQASYSKCPTLLEIKQAREDLR